MLKRDDNMKTVKLLHCADIHIGAAESFLGDSAAKRRFETLLTFEKIMDIALSSKVDIVAVAGDLFDSNTIEERFIEAVFSKISAISPIKVVFSAGNHDPLNTESPFLRDNLPENLYVLGPKDECIPFENIGVNIYGRSFENSFLKGETAFTLPVRADRINILVQHGDLCHDLNSDYNAITPQFVKESTMDYIALGHKHTHTEIGRIDNTFFAYSGCPEGQGFDETDSKGIYIGEIGKGYCNLQFIPISKRLHIHEKIDITGLCDNGEISSYILESLAKDYGGGFSENLYKIELTGDISPDFQLLLAEIESRLSAELYFVKLKDSTEFKIDYISLSNEKSLKGIFVKKMLEKQQTASDEQKEILKQALKLGIKAFMGEVKYDED